MTLHAHRKSNTFLISLVIWGIPLLALVFIAAKDDLMNGSILSLVLFWLLEIYLTATTIQNEWAWESLKKELTAGEVSTTSSKGLIAQILARDICRIHYAQFTVGFIFIGEIISAKLCVEPLKQKPIPSGYLALGVVYFFHMVCALVALIAFLRVSYRRIRTIAANPHYFDRNALSTRKPFITLEGGIAKHLQVKEHERISNGKIIFLLSLVVVIAIGLSRHFLEKWIELIFS